MRQNVIVIGGAGFIGSHLVDILIRSDYNVIVYDNFSTGKLDYLPKYENLTIVEGDILNATKIRDTVKYYHPFICYHLAAMHYIPACEQYPERALRVNVEGTQTVLNACRDIVSKVIFASTGAIYDPSIKTALSENSGVVAKDIYGLTKYTGEHLFEYFIEKGNCTGIVARLFNAVGPRETNPHLVPTILQQLLKGVRQIELGNLFPKRDYIHVQDIAEALFAMLPTISSKSFEIYNVGSGLEYSVENIVRMCSEIIDEPINVESVESRRRKCDRPNQLADIDKLKEHTNWYPRRSLKQALADAWHELKIKNVHP